MEDNEKKSIIESLLFIAGEPLALEMIAKTSDIPQDEAGSFVQELISEYMLRDSGVMIVEVAEGVQMVTNPASAPWVKKLIATAIPTKLSNQSLETLSIIAYKQPIIKSEVEAIRGVNSDGVVKTLLERRMVKILGRKEVPGRPLMYGTTKEFLQYFGLKDLSELPTLKDFEEEETEGLLTADIEGLEMMKQKGAELDEGEEAEAPAVPEVSTGDVESLSEPDVSDEGEEEISGVPEVDEVIIEQGDEGSLSDPDMEEVEVDAEAEPETETSRPVE